MDELKLTRWRLDFTNAALTLKEGYDAFFPLKKFADAYRLETTDSQVLALVIDHDAMPKEIEERLKEILDRTRPEDSI